MPLPVAAQDLAASLDAKRSRWGDIRDGYVVGPYDHLGNYEVDMEDGTRVRAALAFNGGGTFAPGTKVSLGSKSASDSGHVILGTAPSSPGGAPGAAPRTLPAKPAPPAPEPPPPAPLHALVLDFDGGMTIKALAYDSTTGAYLSERASLTASVFYWTQQVSLIAHDSVGKVGDGAFIWVSGGGPGQAPQVWDVAGSVSRALPLASDQGSMAAYSGGWVYWIETLASFLKTGGAATFLLRRARADASEVSTVVSVALDAAALGASGFGTSVFVTLTEFSSSTTAVSVAALWSCGSSRGRTRVRLSFGGSSSVGILAPGPLSAWDTLSHGIPGGAGCLLSTLSASDGSIKTLWSRPDDETSEWARLWPTTYDMPVEILNASASLDRTRAATYCQDGAGHGLLYSGSVASPAASPAILHLADSPGGAPLFAFLGG